MKKLNIEEFCPEHFMQKIDGRQYGTVENVEYFSAACNKTRPANVLLPNGYDPKVKYPVLYVLHGFFCTQFTMLQDDDSCNQKIIANLIEEKLAKPMIVVFPYIFASTTKEVCDGFSEENVNAYNNFLNDLTGDLMPFIEKKYSVKTGAENTAIIGFSMGGRESLAAGITYPKKFGYVGAIAPAPGLVPCKDSIMQHPGQFAGEDKIVFDGDLQILMVCCGDSDKVVVDFPEQYHNIMVKNRQPHDWYLVTGSDHANPAIASGIYNFCKNIF